MLDAAGATGGGAIAVVDDDADVREAVAVLLGTLLGTEGRRTATYASAEALLRSGPAAALSCVLVDVRMPGGMDGIALLRELRRRGHPAPVLVMTGHGDVPLAVRAMREGAFDFIEKPFDDTALLDAIAAAVASARTEAASPRGDEEAKARVRGLSPRERDVLDGLLAGRANKAIAFDLGISPRTVEVHRAKLMEKLGVRSVGEAVRIALAAGVGTGERPAGRDGKG